MELWATGFNAWNNLNFEDTEQKQAQLLADHKTFRCILNDKSIELLRTTIESTLVKTSTGVYLAGRSTPITTLHTQNPQRFANTAIAGNDRVIELKDGTITEYAKLSDCIEKENGTSYTEMKDIIKVSAGQTIFTALSSTGEVYTWGDPRYEATLGREISPETPAQTPSQIPDLSSLPTGSIQHISSGGYTTAALTTTNDLYLWGFRLGQTPLLPDLTSEPTPFDLDGEDVLDVAVGMDHIIALSVSNRVFVVGSNGNGQLGLEGSKEADECREVVLPLREEQVVVGVFAGYKNSFVLVDTRK